MSSDTIIYRRPTADLLATTGNVDAARSDQSVIYEALVVDVILDHTHPEYSHRDGYNVGTIKVRIFNVNQTLDDSLLPWADPVDLTFHEMPLIGELVTLYKIRGNFFYSKKIPLARRQQENGMLNLNAALNNRGSNTLANAVANQSELSPDTHKFGEYFKPDNRIRQLKHFEGDILFQGRMGQSIRFGSSQMDPSSEGMAPNIVLRTGQGKDLEKTDISIDTVFGVLLEDVNKDASSIWMTADQVVPFEPTTLRAGSFVRSVANPPQKFDKAQVIINSDRVVLNSKKTHIMMFANEGIHLNSFKDTTIDTDNNIILTANIDIRQNASRNIENIADHDFTVHAGNEILTLAIGKTSMLSDKIYVGSVDNDKEPMVGGTSLSKFLARFILALTATKMGTPPASFLSTVNTMTHVITPTGPGRLAPAVVSALSALYKDLVPTNSGQKKPAAFAGAIFNSEDNFVMLANEIPKMEKNEFEPGEQIKTENNKWILTEPYYRVL